MGHKHSKWSIHSKQKKTFASSSNYKDITPSYSPYALGSHDASMGTMENNYLMQTRGRPKNFEGDQNIPLLSQAAAPFQRSSEPIIEEAQEAKPTEWGPLYVGPPILSVENNHTLPNELALEESELYIEMAEEPTENIEEAEMTKITIWTIDDVDWDDEIKIELEEHPESVFKMKGHKDSKVYSRKMCSSM